MISTYTIVMADTGGYGHEPDGHGSLSEKEWCDRERSQAGLDLEKAQNALMDVICLTLIVGSNIQTTKLYHIYIYSCTSVRGCQSRTLNILSCTAPSISSIDPSSRSRLSDRPEQK
jgi:hypothetical protein